MADLVCPQCKALNRDTSRYCFECGAPLLAGVTGADNTQKAGTHLVAGKVLQDRYRIIDELGRGGFGAVYKAWDDRLNKAVAVKENLEISPEAQRQFTREALVLAKLSHPNLPRVTDYFSLTAQGDYLVMDFVEGEDLARVVARQRTVPVAQAVGWISQVAGALDYLHSQQPSVLHRDVKPANIRITPAGQAMLVDFGLVKMYDPNLKTTLGARAVSPGFAPPEQYGRGSTDARADIYALAATLYTLLTGNEPVESIRRLTGTTLPPAAQVNPAVPVQLSQVIEQAMSLDPAGRYTSAAEFKAALTSNPPEASVVQVVGPETVIQARPVIVPAQMATRAVTTDALLQTTGPAAPVQTTGPATLVQTTGPAAPLQTTGPAVRSAASYPLAPEQPQAASSGSRRWIYIAALAGGLGLLVCIGAALLIAGLGGGGITQRTATSDSKATVAAQVQATSTGIAKATGVARTAEASDRQATQTAAVAQAQAPTATIRAPASPTPTSPPKSSSPTQPASDNRTQATAQALAERSGWPVQFFDSFDDNQNDWSEVDEPTGNWKEITVQIQDGLHHTRFVASDDSGWMNWISQNTGKTFSVSLHSRQVGGKADALRGIVFRVVDRDNFYLFGISDDHSFGLWVQRNNQWTKLFGKDWTNHIQPGDWNDLRVVADGEKFQLYINENLVGQTTNNWFASGDVGLYFAVGSDFTAEFESDNLLITAP